MDTPIVCQKTAVLQVVWAAEKRHHHQPPQLMPEVVL